MFLTEEIDDCTMLQPIRYSKRVTPPHLDKKLLERKYEFLKGIYDRWYQLERYEKVLKHDPQHLLYKLGL